MPIVKRGDFGTDRAPEWCRVTGGILKQQPEAQDGRQ